MARPIKQAAVPPAIAGGTSADELAVLHPEREAVIAGRTVTVREYGFIEGLRIAAQAEPFIAALSKIVIPADTPPALADIESVLAEHMDTVKQLVARAADAEVEWVETLGDFDGERLFGLWWEVNAFFFIRRVLRLAIAEVAAAQAVARSAGRGPMPSSSAPAMADAPPTSGATRNGN